MLDSWFINKLKMMDLQDHELDYVSLLLPVNLEEANILTPRVKDSIKGVESLIKTFRSVHRDYVGKIKENSGSLEEINITLGDLDAFLREVEDQI